MKVAAPALLPILRSDTVGNLLARLFLDSEQAVTLTELADELEVSLPTVMREVDRMIASGLAVEERVGRARRVRANTRSALFAPLTELIALTYGPKPVLEKFLTGMEGVDAAVIYGSWAARYRGQTGAEPNDVDVLVIGNADPDELFDVAERARKELHREVSIRSVSARAWNDPAPDDPFLKHVRSRPMVDLDLDAQVEDETAR
jgi:predicted nucleotidyltransferase